METPRSPGFNLPVQVTDDGGVIGGGGEPNDQNKNTLSGAEADGRPRLKSVQELDEEIDHLTLALKDQKKKSAAAHEDLKTAKSSTQYYMSHVFGGDGGHEAHELVLQGHKETEGNHFDELERLQSVRDQQLQWEETHSFEELGEAAVDAADKPTTLAKLAGDDAVAGSWALARQFAGLTPRLRTLSADEAVRQVVASMVYAFAFGTSDKVIAKLAPMVSDVASRQAVLYAVFYVILVTFFCPTFARITRGADLSPTPGVVAVLYGELSPLAFLEKLVLILFGATCGIHITNHFKWYVYDHGVNMMAHRGSFAGALGAEAASAFVVFFVSRAFSAPVFGKNMWLFDKLVYIGVFHQEGCKYSCTILNPVMSLANTMVVHGPSHYMNASAWWAVAPYCLGAPAGCFAARVAVDAARVAVHAARGAVQKKKKD